MVGDEERISQILVNLLSNASKLRKKARIRVTFRQMMRNENSVEFLFRVHDTGKGMDPKFIKRIFHPFEQGTPGSQNRYAVRSRYGDHGQADPADGRLDLSREHAGEGSDFSVYLTLPLADHPENLAADDTAQDSDDFTYEGCNILMAEDNEVKRGDRREHLRLSGASVDVAVNGRDAVDKFAASLPGTYDLFSWISRCRR